jgi:tellurite resistance protein TehA-like permease
LSPAYFAVIMATGIVSLASYIHGLETIAITLFRINIAAWIALMVLNVVRMVRHSKRYFADMVDHLRGSGLLHCSSGDRGSRQSIRRACSG